MPSAHISFESGDYPLRRFFGNTSPELNRFKYVIAFSDHVFPVAGTLTTRQEFIDQEVLELRNAATTQWTEATCSPSGKTFTNTIVTGDPSGSESPTELGLYVFGSLNALESNYYETHTFTTNFNGTEATFVVPTLETNFDWTIGPNFFYRDSVSQFHQGSTYTIAPNTPVGGSTTITVTGITPPMGVSVMEDVIPAGIFLALVEPYSTTIDPGMPPTITLTLKAGPFTETAT